MSHGAEDSRAAIYLSSVIAPALIFTAVFFWETVAAEKCGNYLREKFPRRAGDADAANNCKSEPIWRVESQKSQTDPGKDIVLFLKKEKKKSIS